MWLELHEGSAVKFVILDSWQTFSIGMGGTALKLLCRLIGI